MRNVENYGIAPYDYERRKKFDEMQLQDVAEALDKIIDFIKEETKNGDWLRMSFAQMKKIHDFPKANNRETLLFALKSHKNIISRIRFDRFDEVTAISNSAPILYRFVEEEIKENMGFDAVMYRRIINTRLELVKEAFKDEKVDVNAICCILDHLIREKATEGWIRIEPIAIDRLCGIPIDVVLDGIDKLAEKKLIVVETLLDKAGDPFMVGCVCMDGMTYEKAMSDVQNEHIQLFENVRRKRRKRGFGTKLEEAIKERKAVIPADPNFSKMVEMAAGKSIFLRKLDEYQIPNEYTEQLEKIDHKTEKTIDNLPEYAKMVSDSISNVLQNYLETTLKIVGNAEEKDAELFKLLDEVTKERTSLQEANIELQQKVQQLEGVVSALKEYNEVFIENSREQLMVLIGNIISRIEKAMTIDFRERNTDSVAATIKVDLFNLVSEGVDSMRRFKPESKMPPISK